MGRRSSQDLPGEPAMKTAVLVLILALLAQGAAAQRGERFRGYEEPPASTSTTRSSRP